MKEEKQSISEELLQLIREEWAPGETVQPEMKLNSLNSWNSLNALLLWGLIKRRFGIELPMNVFYKDITIKEMALYIQDNQNKSQN